MLAFCVAVYSELQLCSAQRVILFAWNVCCDVFWPLHTTPTQQHVMIRCVVGLLVVLILLLFSLTTELN